MSAMHRLARRSPLGSSPWPAIRRSLGAILPVVVLVAAWLAGPPAVAVHGTVAPDAPTVATFLLDWSFDPTIQAPLLLAAALWLVAVGRVNAAHPANPVPRRRTVAFLAGLAAIEVALQSGIDAYDTTLFSVHMVQHILLTFAAAPLIALAAPITLLLRVARSDLRRRIVLRVLHSLPVRTLTFPVVSWLLFAGAMWGTHFSPVFNESLENPLIHDLEHVLYLVTGLLFWWPVAGQDPSPWRMAHPVRALYAFLQMPQNTFLALAIFSAGTPLYAHYATLVRDWGPSPLADQQAAGAIMWVVGDVTFISAIVLLIAAWMRSEDRAAGASDARIAAEEAAIRAREARLAERLAEEGGSRPRSAGR